MQKKSIRLSELALVMIPTLLAAQPVLAHGKSPRAQVSQMVGMTQVSLDYGRPGVRGRVVWGELVPLDEPWRTGADQATTITFDKPVMVGGKHLDAGTYGLLTIPGKEAWTFVLSTNSKMFGTRNYKAEEDAVRVEAKPEAAGHCENLLFVFDSLSEDSADVVLCWEKLKVSFTVQSAHHHSE